MSEKRKLPIDRPCSACSAGDTKMEYHDHRPPFREPVASPQATRPHTEDCSIHGCEGYNGPRWCDCGAAQPTAGTRYEVTVSQGGTTGCTEIANPSGAAQPAAGTTPQAERLELLALRKKFKDEHMLNEQDSARSEELIEIICAPRAVAPVETPDDELCQNCHRENPVWFAPNAVWNAVVTEISGILCPICFINRAEQQGFRCTGWELVPELVDRPTDDKTPVGVGAPANLAPAETRLTAEQFWKEVMHFPKEVIRKLTMWECEKLDQIIIESLEAFRDKSEAQSQQFAAQLESNIQFLNERVAEQKRYIDQCHTAHAGLREENERLKEGERLVRDFLERDYGVSEITTICSRYDDAEQELTELRAKLAEQEKWALAFDAVMRELAMWFKPDGRIHYPEDGPKLVKELGTRAQAAEAEAAALRERERWISVKEKLPGENVRVHIWFLDTGKEWRERYGEISCGHWRPEGGNGNFDDRVTHWKALSAAPEATK